MGWDLWNQKVKEILYLDWANSVNTCGGFQEEQADMAEGGMWWKTRLKKENGVRSGDGLKVTLNCYKLTSRTTTESPEKFWKKGAT